MEKKFTPGKWSQGITLHTKLTAKWTKEQIEANDLNEKLHVFANFEGFDEGKSRKLVAACTNVHDAKLIAAAPALLATLQKVKERIETSDSWWMSSPGKGGFDLDEIESVIKKATE